MNGRDIGTYAFSSGYGYNKLVLTGGNQPGRGKVWYDIVVRTGAVRESGNLAKLNEDGVVNLMDLAIFTKNWLWLAVWF